MKHCLLYLNDLFLAEEFQDHLEPRGHEEPSACLVYAPPAGDDLGDPHYSFDILGTVDSMMLMWRPLLVKH